MRFHVLCFGCREEHQRLVQTAAAGLPWRVRAEEADGRQLPIRLWQRLHEYTLVVMDDQGLDGLLAGASPEGEDEWLGRCPGRCLFLLTPAAFFRLGQLRFQPPAHWILLGEDAVPRLRRYLEEVAARPFMPAAETSGAPPLITEHSGDEQGTHQSQRVQVQKQAALKLLAGGVAHDFNNILNGIMGYLSLIKLDLDRSSPYYDYLEDIEKSARRGVELSSLLLRYSRRRQLNRVVMNLNDVVRQATDEALVDAGGRIGVEYDLSDDLPAMEADAHQIRDAVVQICRNGAAAMAEGGRLRVATGWRLLELHDPRNLMALPEGNYLAVEIADSGAGMSEEVRDRMFEPYFTTRKEIGGRGLGLTVAYSVMAAHDGGLLVDSRPGEGTVITLLFPLAEEAVSETVSVAGDAATRQQVRPRVPCILLVDDDEMVRNTASRLFRKLGYAVRVAEDGREALTVFAEEAGAIDLVFLDMIMPRLNGEQTFTALRKRNPRLPVVLISGYSVDHTIRELLRQGAAGFLQKPISLEDIQAILHRTLPRSPQNGA